MIQVTLIILQSLAYLWPVRMESLPNYGGPPPGTVSEPLHIYFTEDRSDVGWIVCTSLSLIKTDMYRSLIIKQKVLVLVAKGSPGP